MIKKSIKIAMEARSEARPVAMLVQVASRFESRIYIESGTKKVNAKSIMGMMTLKLDDGEEIVVSADGSDEENALNEIENYLSAPVSR